MSFGCQYIPSLHVSTLPKPKQRVARLRVAGIRCVCRLGSSQIQRDASGTPPQHRIPRPQPLPQPPPFLSRLLAGCSATAASLLFPRLPSWASDSFDFMSDTYLDASVSESPDILNTLLIVVVTYFTVMMLYLWLSSFMDDEESGGTATGGDKQQQQQQPPADQGGQLPPGYGSFLNAHVRSYVSPHSRPVRALQALQQAEPLEGENYDQYKGRLAAAAAEALDQQISDCERLVRTKLLARKMGYAPGRAAEKTGSSGGGSSGSSHHHQHHDAASDVYSLLSSHVLNSPQGLSSPEHRATVEALIEQHLDDLLPPGGGAFQDELMVRQVMRRLVGHLVMEESLLLLEGMEHGKKQLEASGRVNKAGSKSWALW